MPIRPRHFFIGVAGLLICFSLPLFRLIRFSISSELYSHILLVPFVSAYFAWNTRRDAKESGGAAIWAAAFLILSLLAAVFYLALWTSPTLAIEDHLALGTSSFILGLYCLVAWQGGRSALRAYAFPLGFLLFMIPLPVMTEQWVESTLQHGSAFFAASLFRLIGTPMLYDNLVFNLPGFAMQVAPECSGIHSTLALFVTSVVAGHVFLRTPWKRLLIALVVFPLGLIRNGIRVFIIGELCVRIGPHMIDSYIHRHGGPIFFAASLVPFLVLIWGLSKSEDNEKSELGRPPAVAENPSR